jgi:TolA-binding protein
MTRRLAALVCLLGIALATASNAFGLSYYWGSHPDRDRLVFVFPGEIPEYTLERVDAKTIQLTLPEGYWSTVPKPDATLLYATKLIKNVVPTPTGLVVDLQTNAFGFMFFPLKDSNKLVLDVFDDPMGVKWKPASKTGLDLPPANEQQTTQAVPPALGEDGQAPSPFPGVSPTRYDPAPAPSVSPQIDKKAGISMIAPRPDPAAPKSQNQDGKTTGETGQDKNQGNLFGVPYTYRAQINPGAAPPPAQASPQPQATVAPQPSAPEAQAPTQPTPPAAQPQAPAARQTPAQATGKPQQPLSPAASQSAAPTASASSPPQQAPAAPAPLPAPTAPVSPVAPPTAVAPPKPGAAQPAPPAAKTAPTTPTPQQNGTGKNREQLPRPKPPQTSSAAPDGSQDTANAPSPEAAAQTAQTAPTGANAVQPSAEPGKAQTAVQTQAGSAPESGSAQTAYSFRSKIGAPGQEAPKAAPDKGPPEAQAVAGPAQTPASTTPNAAQAPPSAPITAQQDAAPAPSVAQAAKPVAPPVPRDAGEKPTAQGEPAAADSKVPAAATAAAPEKTDEPGAPHAPAAPLDQPAKVAQAAEAAKSEEAPEPPPASPNKAEALEPPQVLEQAKKALTNGMYPQALELLTQLKNTPNLPKDLREEMLYLYADALFALNKDNLKLNYGKIADAYSLAMNYNPQSSRMPQGLFQMGILNLRVDNTKMADTFFNILKKKYPDDELIPLTHYYWGDYYFNKEKYQDAADQFQYFIQKYPDNKFVREAALGLAKTLYKLDLNEQAFQITDYIEKRWPRFYVEYPPLLRLVADVNYKSNNLDKAKYAYWTLYNLEPSGEEMDLILARLGDIYLQQGMKPMAKDVYELASKRFPDRDGGLISQMRLAEEGVYDEPVIKDMFSIFNRPYTTKPVDVYTRIVEKFPDSNLAPLAQLKLAMWYLWNKKNRDALDAAKAFEKKFPQSKLLPNAREVALKAFEELLTQLLAENNYTGLSKFWEDNASLHGDETPINPEMKIGVATGYWKKGETQKALDLLEPFFRGPGMQRFAEAALLLALNIQLAERNWDQVIELGRKVELWDLSDRVKDKLTYSLALAYENKDQPDKSQPLWDQLAQRKSGDPSELAYVNYFLAQAAKNKKDFRAAHEYAQYSLSYFQQSDSDPDKVKDLLALLVDVNERSGRPREALKWSIDYSQYVKKEDPEWPALRFRMAQLYRKLGDNKRWQAIMEELAKDMPTALYGRMAAAELSTQALEKKVNQFAPLGQF